jgi:hypothetical protein
VQGVGSYGGWESVGFVVVVVDVVVVDPWWCFLVDDGVVDVVVVDVVTGT